MFQSLKYKRGSSSANQLFIIANLTEQVWCVITFQIYGVSRLTTTARVGLFNKARSTVQSIKNLQLLLGQQIRLIREVGHTIEIQKTDNFLG